MSTICDVVIPVSEIRIDLRHELFNILSSFRPGNPGEIKDNHVTDFPNDFSDDPTGDLTDFAQKHGLSFRATCYFPDEMEDEFIMEFEDGNLISAGIDCDE